MRRWTRGVNGLVAGLLSGIGVLAVGGVAEAASNPASTLISVRCGIQGAPPPIDGQCGDFKFKNNTAAVLDGTVEFLSGGVVVAAEQNPVVLVLPDDEDSGVVSILATGNGNQVLFDAWYKNPQTSILNAPDVSIRIWSNTKKGQVLSLNQRYATLGSALWALHSEDTALEQARAKAAETALQNAISQGDAALNAALNGEINRAKAAELALQNSINNGGNNVLVQANIYTDQQIAIEVAARKQGDLDTLAAAKLYTDQQGASLQAALNTEIARAQAEELKKANVSLNNLSEVAINTSLVPAVSNGINLGTSEVSWHTLYLTNNADQTAGLTFQPSAGGKKTLLQAAPASDGRLITLPNASGTVAVSASGNIALDAAGNLTFAGTLPLASGGTNNTAFNAGKFVAFDGTKLASTSFDSASFAQADAGLDVVAGAGLGGGGNVKLGGSITLTNGGVTGLVATDGLTASAATGNITLGATLGGDLGKNLDTALVTGLQGRPVSPAAPNKGDLLSWDGAAWSSIPNTGVDGNGTVNRLTRWNGASTLTNASISDDGVTVAVTAALNAQGGLGIAGDYRTSWNGQDANSVNPMPRTCPVGQVPTSTGPYKWTCSAGGGGGCPVGQADCDGNPANFCEVNIGGDINNCGGCGVVCSANNIAAVTCNGTCNGACSVGFADCDNNKQLNGCEVAPATDPDNCGACGVTCSGANMALRTCAGGVCNGTCSANFADCNGNKQSDGCETDVKNSPNNCGGCGFVCSNLNMASRTCGGGVCNGSCNAGFGDCNGNKLADGCETNLGNDVLNCGGCGSVCSTNNVNRACSGGSCQAGSCNAGFADCNNNKKSDGCEININTNVNNCGACGVVCPAVANGTAACASGACAIGACNANFFNVNGQLGDGCECNAPGLNACGSAVNLGQLAFAAQVVQNGVSPGGTGEHWYTMNFANSGASYHPHVYINSGANYVIDVFNGCGGGQFNCGEGGTSTGTTNWEVNQTAGDPGTGSGTFAWATPSPGTQIWVRVRATANTGCSGYQVVFVNG